MSEPRPAPKPEAVADSDKLPWLEPYRERGAKVEPVKAPAAKAPAAAKPTRRGGGTALLGIVGALALGGAGYWFGRETAPQEVFTPQTTVIAPLPPSPIPVQRDGDLAYRSLGDDLAEPMVSEDLDIAPPPEPEPVAERPAPRPEPVARAVRETPPPPPPAPPPPRPRAIEPSTLPAPAPSVAAPIVTAAPLPAPVVVHRNVTPAAVVSSNQTIELGAFISRKTANVAYKRVVRRYPYLGTRPKTITAYPRSAGWPPVYRLRLGTGSARNARTLCRYVRSIGQRCAVV